jgi:hypothetical protein
VAGLMALAAIAAAGAGVGAGLGSLPGKPGLAGAPGQRPPQRSDSSGGLVVPAPGRVDGGARIQSGSLGSFAAPMVRRALVGARIPPRHPIVTGHSPSRGTSQSAGTTHGSVRVSMPQPSGRNQSQQTIQTPARPTDPTTSSGQPSDGGQSPNATPAPSQGQGGPDQSAGGSPDSHPSDGSSGQTTSSSESKGDRSVARTGTGSTSKTPKPTTPSDS